MKRNFNRLLFLILIFLGNSASAAPFLIDDPNITGYRHYELYLYTYLNQNNEPTEEPQLQGPSVEFDLGLSQNVQLQINAPYAWALPIGGQVPASNGLGDFQAPVKYRFVKDDKNNLQMAIFPGVLIPLGNANQNLGNGTPALSLPVWAQKKWGKWTLNGGGGYALNPALDARNFPFGGVELERKLSKKLYLGLEIYSQGAVNRQTREYTTVDAGGYYNFTDHFSMLFLAGHSILGERHFLAYFGLEWTGGG